MIRVTPQHMPWGKEGCTVIDTWETPVKSGDRVGMQHWVKYRNGKGKIIEMVRYVKWSP